MLTDLDELTNQETEESATTNSHTQRYLEKQEEKFYQNIQTRKLIGNWLLFAACQASSASLAFLLFHLAIDITIISLVCAVVALIPTLGEWAEFSVQKSDDTWNLTLMHKPIVTIFKTAVGITVAVVSVWEVKNLIIQTNDQILAVYEEIKNYELMQKHTQYPDAIAIIVAVVIVALAVLFRRP